MLLKTEKETPAVLHFFPCAPSDPQLVEPKSTKSSIISPWIFEFYAAEPKWSADVSLRPKLFFSTTDYPSVGPEISLILPLLSTSICTQLSVRSVPDTSFHPIFTFSLNSTLFNASNTWLQLPTLSTFHIELVFYSKTNTRHTKHKTHNNPRFSLLALLLLLIFVWFSLVTCTITPPGTKMTHIPTTSITTKPKIKHILTITGPDTLGDRAAASSSPSA